MLAQRHLVGPTPLHWLFRASGVAGLVGLALLIGAASLPVLLIGAAAALGLAMALLWPAGLLYPLVLSVPFASLIELEADDFTVSATEVLVALIVGGWLLESAARRELRLAGSPLLVCTLWVLAVMLLTLPGAFKLSLALKESAKWLELVVVFLFVAHHTRRWADVQRLLVVLLVAGVTESLYAFYRLATEESPSSFAVGSLVRAYGTFDQPNPFAGYLGTLIPLAVALVISLQTRWLRLAAAGGTLVLLAAFLASQSRGAWLGLGTATLVVLFVSSRQSRRLLPPLLFGVAVTVALGLAGALPAAVTDRLTTAAEYVGLFDVRDVQATPENWALLERMAHWQAGWYMFLDHPLLGVGAGNYPAAYERYYLPGWEEALGHAHNYYLNVAAELGILGLLGMLALLGAAFAAASKALRATDASSSWRVLAAALLASLVVFSLHNLFDNLLVHGMSVQIGLILGLMAMISMRVEREASEATYRWPA